MHIRMIISGDAFWLIPPRERRAVTFKFRAAPLSKAQLADLIQIPERRQ